jgi:hypothetical protein
MNRPISHFAGSRMRVRSKSELAEPGVCGFMADQVPA